MEQRFFEAATFIAILLGTILAMFALTTVGEILTTHPWVPVSMIILSFIGWFATLFIPKAEPEGGPVKIQWNPFRSNWTLIQEARNNLGVWRAILGISWFWALGAIWLSYIPPYVKDVLKLGNEMAGYFLLIFSVGIGMGSLFTAKIQRGKINAHAVPVAGFGLSLGTILFVWAQTISAPEPFLLSSLKGWVVSGALMIIGICGGVFSVPLYAIMQAWSEPSHRARNVATNNVMNSFFMVGASVMAIILGLAGYTGISVLLVMATLNIFVSFYMKRLSYQNSPQF